MGKEIEYPFPSPAELTRIECDTLKYLRCNSDVRQMSGTIGSKADQAFAAAKQGLIDFAACMELNVNDRSGKPCERRIDVGAIVKVDRKTYETVSYSLSICEGNSPGRILKKLHLDYEPSKSGKGKLKKPAFHMQFPGTLTPHMNNDGFTDNHLSHLCPWFSAPRVTTVPVSLALLLNIVWMEFCNDNEKIHNIVESQSWRNHIYEVEENLLKKHFSICAEFFANRKQQLFTNDFVYR